jgi:hypothetical protein
MPCFFQVPQLPETILRADHWYVAASSLCRISKKNAFTEENIEKYKVQRSLVPTRRHDRHAQLVSCRVLESAANIKRCVSGCAH